MSVDHRPIVARLKGKSADDQPIVQFCDFLSKSVNIVFNVITSVSRPIDVYWPIKIQTSYPPTVFFNVIAELHTIFGCRAWFVSDLVGNHET